MHADDRKAFDTILAEMFGAIDKPLGEATREAFWKGCQRMSIVEFSRCRDQLLDDLQDGERPRTFGVPNVWAIKGKLRAAAPTKFDDGWRGDDWDERANLRLLAHLMRAAVNRRKYTPEQTHFLAAFKNHWADTMRAAGDVPMGEQNESWTAGIRQVEAEFTKAKAA